MLHICISTYVCMYAYIMYVCVCVYTHTHTHTHVSTNKYISLGWNEVLCHILDCLKTRTWRPANACSFVASISHEAPLVVKDHENAVTIRQRPLEVAFEIIYLDCLITGNYQIIFRPNRDIRRIVSRRMLQGCDWPQVQSIATEHLWSLSPFLPGNGLPARVSRSCL